ncbi:DNA-directed RNA polymerase III subunit RPC10 [Geranomyces variabilis]|uniref:DNA-directed RNA polymerase subunit n=1 Tax=Geranomyces variabilis TaxID=109894 RepID=A0AAD5TJK1_9FUNG|nr:DNA-directed RNA polymerase III subunit RPC10 [Geranomyces variabilis]
MYFCPSCSNLLLIGQAETGQNQFVCQTCPYVCKIDKPITSRTSYKRKVVDDVLGGSAAWENVDSTKARCPKCEHNRAYFMMLQIRSADEPMSIFYKCVSCAEQWREG